MGEFSQKIAIVTGGARGIGRQTALTLAARGADLVIGDMSDMESAATEIRSATGRQVVTVKADVTVRDDVNRLVDAAIEKFGQIDILVNNAGITRRAPLLEMSEEDWDAVLGVNLKGVFLCTQAAARYMAQRRFGKIVNMASIAGTTALLAGTANYAVSKAAVIRLTAASALELGPHGINVNAVAPGSVITDISRTGRTQQEFERWVEESAQKSALHRVGTVQDIANAVAFLASEQASFITGQVIPVEGARK